MQGLIPLKNLEPLERLEVKLNHMQKRDTKKYYSNLDLIYISTNLLYLSSLQLNEIEEKRKQSTLTKEEHNKLLREVKNLSNKALVYSDAFNKNPIYWNDEDITNELNKRMLGNVEEC